MKEGDTVVFCGFEHRVLSVNNSRKVATIGLLDSYGAVRDSFETIFANITVVKEV